MSANHKFIFRRAGNEKDIRQVRAMIQELADFLRTPNGPQCTVEDLVRDSGLLGGPEYCHVYILELEDAEKKIIPIGYTCCFFCYSTWQGRSYFLEDIYVKPEYRKMGAGKRIFHGIAEHARNYGAKRIDFHVNAWNEARKFYERMGAIDLSEIPGEEWHLFRVREDQIAKLAAAAKTL